MNTGSASAPEPAGEDRFAGRVVLGIVFAVLLVGGIGGWAATARLNGAVIATGSVKVDQNLKVIQHRDGGIVAEIAVREGDDVARGQILFRLDDAQSRAEVSILGAQLVEAEARRARLLAERTGAAEIHFPEHIRNAGAAADAVMAGETRLHGGNVASREAERQQLVLSIDQITEEIAGLEAQRAALSDEARLVDASQVRLASLVEKNLVESTRLDAAERERAQMRGRLGELGAAIARARLRISEINVRILAIDDQARTDAQRELVVVESRIGELTERMAAVRDRIARTEIRAPIAGKINELRIFTVGGVISPAEVLATIVPEDANLRVEVRLSPTTIDQIYVGQAVRVRFSAFSHRTTPELAGRIGSVAPATTRDEKTGEPFYAAIVDIPQTEIDRLGGLQLVPGMPVEAHITTAEQTALAYFLKPISDQMERALKEE